jgi:hypothetical protein
VGKVQARGAFLGGGAQERSRGTNFVRRSALEAKCAQAKGERALLLIVSYLQVGKSRQRQGKWKRRTKAKGALF